MIPHFVTAPFFISPKSSKINYSIDENDKTMV